MATRRMGANATAPTTTPLASRTATPARGSTRTRASTTTADRYYDPELARFIQPDSTVPDPEFSQAYNRYAYVYNNPLKFSDPTGQFPFLVGLVISMAVSGGMAAATGGNIIKAMVMGAFSYAVGFGVGQIVSGFEVVGWGVTATGSAMVGGAVAGALNAVMMHGNPLLGAAMGATSAGAGIKLAETLPGVFTWIDDIYLRDLAASTAAGVLIGGVTAEVMGGDFGEGAAYGAASAAAGWVVAFAIRIYQIKSMISEMLRTGEIPDEVMDMDLASTLVVEDARTPESDLQTVSGDEYRPTPNPLAALLARLLRCGPQLHHWISKPIYRELQNNPNLKGQYKYRDPRFVSRAKDLQSHKGYQEWHRDLDNKVVNWLKSNRNATPQQFERYLRNEYSKPYLRETFPKGLR